MDAVTEVEVEVGQVPYNFQLNHGRAIAARGKPATPAGELEIRTGCTGERIGWISLAQATSPALTRLTVPVAPQKGAQDLCMTFTGNGNNPLWTIKSVQLREKAAR
jgi:hexosaminidase